MHYWVGGLYEKEDGLTAAQNRRGAFNNSGSRDVGKDENWDFRTGRYGGYDEVAKEARLPAAYMATAGGDESQLEAFAKGLRKSDGN